MGFLDKRDRVTDFVLTERGRELYASGRLDFAYFSLLDDGLDYDPWSTGSLSDADRELQVRALPMWEAPVVRDVRGATAPLEPIRHLFSASPGYGTVPALSSPVDGSSLVLMCDQGRDADGSYRRTGTSLAQIDLSLRGEVAGENPGFAIRVFSSGSTGLTELLPRRDLAGRRSLDPFVSISIDSETVSDVGSVDDPTSRRRSSAALGPNVRTQTRPRG